MERLRVATFNIHHGEGLDGRIDLARTAERIRSSGAELVALQELDRDLARSGRINQSTILTGLLDMQVHFFPTIERDAGSYGIGIACADPLTPRFVSLPRVGEEEPRGAITFRWRGCSVIATHLSPDPAARKAQILKLVAMASGSIPPVLVMGDLNCGRLGLRPFLSAGFRGAPGWPRTTERGLPRHIDHILGGPGAPIERSWTLGEGASDHRLLAAEIQVA